MSYVKFLKNKGLNNISILWFSQIAAAIVAFLTQLLLVRLLTTEEYGAFATALTFTGIVASLSGFGIGPFLLRVFGKEGSEGYRWINKSLKMAFLSFISALCVLFFLTWILDFSIETRFLMMFFSSIVISQGLATISYSRYQLEGKFNKLAMFQFLTHGLRLLVVIIVYTVSPSLINVGIGYAIASVILIGLYSPSIYKLFRHELNLQGHEKNKLTLNKRNKQYLESEVTFRNTFVLSAPFFLAGTFYLIYFQSNIFLLNIFDTPQSAAIYNVVFTVLTVVYLFPSALYQGYLLPQIHRWAEHDKTKITTIYDLGSKAILTFGFFLATVVIIISPQAIEVLFGKEYLLAGTLLIIVSISIPFRLLGNNLGSILVTENNIRKKVFYQALGAIFNLVCNILLIKFLGLYGVVITTVLTEVLITMLFAYGVNKYIPEVKAHNVTKKKQYITASLTCMVLILFYIYTYNFELSILRILMFSLSMIAITLYMGMKAISRSKEEKI